MLRLEGDRQHLELCVEHRAAHCVGPRPDLEPTDSPTTPPLHGDGPKGLSQSFGTKPPLYCKSPNPLSSFLLDLRCCRFFPARVPSQWSKSPEGPPFETPTPVGPPRSPRTGSSPSSTSSLSPFFTASKRDLASLPSKCELASKCKLASLPSECELAPKCELAPSPRTGSSHSSTSTAGTSASPT